jgi:hypothetical protein
LSQLGREEELLLLLEGGQVEGRHQEGQLLLIANVVLSKAEPRNEANIAKKVVLIRLKVQV